ncbi:polysaccharide lyase family 8 super-sandwich domain-containing protein [Pedobacter sp. SYP-B3415]|uniref:polysaccharide lyase family 8 super-sandwich domain-containing protein n=1 Tax=Pedobacter sp. SYP-B3415 TaxID=2496641 RepID=UPI00101DE7D6|nr:polysaccharide lyase family 8 super-sandwich domain-containing protein [Pedobacter sp. SYP-B3415]
MHIRRLRYIFFFLVCCTATVRAQNGHHEILLRYKTYLLHTSAEKIVGFKLASASWPAPDGAGRWPDINYADREPGKWKTLEHFRRLHLLALVLAANKRDAAETVKIRAVFLPALRHWLKERYQNPNWWHNEIGIPQLMRDILILTAGELSEKDLQSAQAVFRQYVVRPKSTGANLVWAADLAFHDAVFRGDWPAMQKWRQAILGELKITTAEGIQPDFSFLQHGARLQMYQYGKALFQESLRLAWQVRGTPLAFPADKMSILRDFVLQGWQWMARGRFTAPGTIDRSVSRPGELASADIRQLMPMLKDLYPADKPTWLALEARQNGRGSLNGFRFYPHADFTAYHQPRFSVFLKTISARTLSTESINNENLLGRLLGSGDSYIIKNGSEYGGMPPVWDWQMLPGLTTFAAAARTERRPFSGAAGNSLGGMTAMDYVLTDDRAESRLEARKLWVFYGSSMLALVAEVQRTGLQTAVYTVADQSRLQATTLRQTRVGGEQIEHNGLTYWFAPGSKIDLKAGPVTGSWKRIDGAASADTVRDQVFMPRIVHGNTPGFHTWYAVSAAGSKQPGWTILANNAAVQAARASDGTHFIAFYTPGARVTSGKTIFSASRPCLLMQRGNRIYVSDPARTAKAIDLQIAAKQYRVVPPADGSTIELTY